MLPLGAGVGDGGAVGGGEGEAPAGSRVLGGGQENCLGFLGVQQAPAGCLRGSGAPAERRAGWHKEVNERGQRRRVTGGVPGRADGWTRKGLDAVERVAALGEVGEG